MIMALSAHVLNAATTGYVLDGKTPLCWVTETQELVDCPDGLTLEILNVEEVRQAMALSPVNTAFKIWLESRVTLNGYDGNVIGWNGEPEIYHANIHSCRDGRFCTPFVKDNEGLATSTNEERASLDINREVQFDQKLTLPSNGVFQVIAHIQFALDIAPNGGSDGTLYDAAVALAVIANNAGDGQGTDGDTKDANGKDDSNVGGIIGGVVAAMVVIGIIVFIAIRHKKKNTQNGQYEQSYTLPTTNQEQYDAYQTPSELNKVVPVVNPVVHGNNTNSQLYDTGNTGFTGSSASAYSRASDMDYAKRNADSGSVGHSNVSGKSTNSDLIRSGQSAEAMNALYGNDNYSNTCNIDSTKIKILDVVGSGSFGEVLRGEYSSSAVAIKRMHAFMPQGEADSFVNEIKLLISLRHPNIVQFIGTSWISDYGLCAITEFMDRGDLTTVLKNAKDHHLDWFDRKMSIAIDTAKSLAYIHNLDHPIIHRDLKSRNILISKSYTAKLSDFGLSRSISMDSTMTCVGSNLWLAPEMIRSEKFSVQADIYSFGVVLTEIDTEQLPFYNILGNNGQRLSGVALAHQVAYKHVRPTMSDTCLPDLKRLAECCMLSDPEERPTAVQILAMLRDIEHDIQVTDKSYEI